MAKHYDKLSPDRPAWLGGGQWIIPNLREVTILFGKNNSGKSVLLRTLQGENRQERHYTSPERAGNIVYDQGVMQRELDESQRGSQRTGNQAARFRQESISRIATLMMKIGAEAGRGRATSPTRSVSPIFDSIEDSVSTLLPNFKFSVTEQQPFFSLMRIEDEFTKEILTQPNQLSSGEAEILTLALDLLTICNIWQLENRRQQLLLIDEPDTHLHPDFQIRLARFLIDLVNNFDAQLLIATHSTTLLASLGHYGRKRVGVVNLNNTQAEQKVIEFDETMRELATCLGGHALMGPLFGAPLLPVEGDDDYRIWSQVPRHPGYRHLFAAIPCDGEEIYKYQETLESLFESLRERGQRPAGYALLDGDKNIPSHCPQEHVRFLRLECKESENLYLVDEVLNKLGLTWAEAQERIIANAESYGEHAAILKACGNWDRRQDDIKKVINSIADILDPKKLHWTERVGKTLGSRTPLGQLSEFLGSDVVTALWSG